MPDIGFKAKPTRTTGRSLSYCTMPDIGFKAKLNLGGVMPDNDCTMPDIGFKAKLGEVPAAAWMHCTMPDIGFKAKRRANALEKRHEKQVIQKQPEAPLRQNLAAKQLSISWTDRIASSGACLCSV